MEKDKNVPSGTEFSLRSALIFLQDPYKLFH